MADTRVNRYKILAGGGMDWDLFAAYWRLQGPDATVEVSQDGGTCWAYCATKWNPMSVDDVKRIRGMFPAITKMTRGGWKDKPDASELRYIPRLSHDDPLYLRARQMEKDVEDARRAEYEQRKAVLQSMANANPDDTSNEAYPTRCSFDLVTTTAGWKPIAEMLNDLIQREFPDGNAVFGPVRMTCSFKVTTPLGKRELLVEALASSEHREQGRLSLTSYAADRAAHEARKGP